MRRENTFKIDYSNFPVKPSVEKVYGFCRSVLGLNRVDIKRLQCHRGGGCAFVKVSDLALAQKVVDEHDAKHEVECDGKNYKLRITLEDGSVEVRIHDLPEDVSEEKVVQFLNAYGEVISIREVFWGESSESEGIPLGIWSTRMLVKRNIDSWVTIDGEQAFVAYKGQLQSCRHCKEQAHTGISCVQNKKLLYQKSYANVAKQTGQVNRATSGQRPTHSAGAKPPTTKAVGQKSTAPPPMSSDNFPELPTKQSEHSDPTTLTPVAVAAATRRAPISLPNFPTLPPPLVLLDNVFKKPTDALRSHSRTSNGNESDESSASTSSRRSRGRPAGKKPRREDADGDNEKEEDSLPTNGSNVV